MNKSLKAILAFSLKNKYFIYFATIILVIYGVITFVNMPIEAFPDVTNTEITVITQWPGSCRQGYQHDPCSRERRGGCGRCMR